jgi:hypothetical protein
MKNLTYISAENIMSIKYLAERFGREAFEIIREEEMEANTDLLVFIRLMDREGQRSFTGGKWRFRNGMV